MMITTENWRLFQEVSDLHAKCLQLERRNNELTKHTAVVATEIACLREDNEFLSGVNAEFGSENNDLKEEIEMKMILKTIKPNDNLDDNKMFNSPKNVEIHSRLIPEL
ncbi:unnamed protein product [Rhizophagus irregularis]|nr:unnamed protein product [Rhizophagus irregularis]